MKYGKKTVIREKVLERNSIVRPGWIFTQVDRSLYAMIDDMIEEFIDNQLESAPSKGKTFRPQGRIK